VKLHYVAIMRTGGAMLVIIGVLLVTGAWNDLVVGLQVWANRFAPAV
jgi:cytochrome c-type biogenesis protein